LEIFTQNQGLTLQCVGLNPYFCDKIWNQYRARWPPSNGAVFALVFLGKFRATSGSS